MGEADPTAVWEPVITVTDFYDRPRGGVAFFEGQPHVYACYFDEASDAYSDNYFLMPIDDDLLALAKEDWAIWLRWRVAFDRGEVALETHPALPSDRPRHAEIVRLSQGMFEIDPARSVLRHGRFRRGRVHYSTAIDAEVAWSAPIDPVPINWKDCR